MYQITKYLLLFFIVLIIFKINNEKSKNEKTNNDEYKSINNQSDLNKTSYISLNETKIYTKVNKNITKKIKKTRNSNRIIKDVLFINGCHTDIVPHPYRYRVLHQMEQLNAGFLESDECFYLNINPFIVKDYRVIIFFRCPWTEKVEEAIDLAKQLNKKVLFDIDDLVIDKKYTDMIPYIKTLSQKEKTIYDDGVMRIGKTLTLCDGDITTTEALAKELNHYVSKVYINRNVASEEMWKLSQEALIKKANNNKNEYIIIGYLSGSITHDSDLEMIKPALIKILSNYKNVKLYLLGELTFPYYLKEFSSQIINKTFTDWRKLINYILFKIYIYIDNIFIVFLLLQIIFLMKQKVKING